MDSTKRRVLFGVLLILAGILFLLQTVFDVVVEGTIFGAFFALGGVAFLILLFTNPKESWWAAIPGFTMLGLGVLIASPVIFGDTFTEHFGGSIFLGSIALSFLVVMLLHPEFWWAVIPAGTLFTLAIVAGLPQTFGSSGLETGALFFVGLGITFGVLGLLPAGRKMKWPWIPAVILLIMGGLIALGSESAIKYLFPVALILGGVFFLVRSFRKTE
ncbi:MAG: hypothetical protein HGA53_09050 [Anaerolineaceae bacterium]|nr:hypothetical protein [Anaerolineaceae bacterium]